MLDFLKKKLPAELLKVRAEEFIKIQAERHLQEQAEIICQGLTVDKIEKMVEADLRLKDLLAETGFKVPKVSAVARPAVTYLQSLSDEQMLVLLDQVGPAQVAVLRRNPEFAHHMIEDLKAIGGV